MKSIHNALLVFGACVAANPLPSTLVRRDDNCSNLPAFVEPGETIGMKDGAPGPSDFCEANWKKGTFPNEIEAWADEHCLRWLRVHYTDGTEKSHGDKPAADTHHRYGTVKWTPFTDTFLRFSLWDGDGSLDAGAYWDNPPPEHNVPRGPNNEGMLLGFEGIEGNCLDTLKPIFTKTRPGRVVLKDAKFEPTFEQLNEKPFEQRMMRANQVSSVVENTRKDGEIEMSLELVLVTEKQMKVTAGGEDSVDKGFEIGGTIKGELSFEVGFPKLVDSKATGGLEVTGKYVQTNTHRNFNSKEDTDIKRSQTGYKVTTKIKAGGKVQCTVVAIQSQVNLRYRATLEQFFQDGSSYSYPVVGNFENAESSEAHTFCEDLDGDKSPPPPSQDDPNRLGEVPVLQVGESGAYCSDGKRVGDAGMSQEELNTACAKPA